MPPPIRAVRLASSLLQISRAHARTPQFLLPSVHRQQQARCASILNRLSDNRAAYQKRIRKGRGPASGKGKTAGRGQKGQHAHGKVPTGFLGGQTPLSITKPPRGNNKYNPFTVEMSPINLDRIQSWIDQGRIDPSKPITMKELAKTRCLHGVKRHGVKLLGRNADTLTSKINIIVSRASSSAIARIEALGGTVTTRFYSPTSIKRVLKGESHPSVSLMADAEFITRAGDSEILSALESAPSSSSDISTSPAALSHDALRAVMRKVGEKYKYRLPDATGRKDIEYYRDPAHRGYLAYTIKEGESPSLYFKPKTEYVDQKKLDRSRQVAKQKAENKLF
ncbi:ribosomal protein L15 [Sporormia fimetaria CBS 119925]|uniref:Ribosomal protein L15 n=1 Tax=Sporormia fimetaria CBS 119925 TaxID=1340428 RepID=A0A6A6VG84_9PLEO|nr:ribosomal protein L15 [Sporormia fimetaria CBS 119925]